MKVSVGLPTHRIDCFDELASADAIRELSVAAESAGFDATFVTEHPFPADRWLKSGGHHALDPFVALSFAAAATTRLRLHTNLCIPSYRNPFLLAKTVATLDALSGGRVILGIGAGYLEGEFAALGAPFDERNDLTDEAIVAMRAAWTGESVTMEGRHFHADGNTMLPAPVQRPARRSGSVATHVAPCSAVELADGWSPMPNPARSAAGVTRPRSRRSTICTASSVVRTKQRLTRAAPAPLEIVFMPLGLDMFTNAPVDAGAVVESVRSLHEIGVTYIATSVPGETRAEVLANYQTFADEILPVIAAL